MRDLGLRIQFGHYDGERCPNPLAAANDFTIINQHGISHVNADYCCCQHRVPRRIQLLRAEIFPSTSRYPKTGVTFRTLETYEKLAAAGKCSVYEYYNALAKLTDGLGINIPKVRAIFQSMATLR